MLQRSDPDNCCAALGERTDSMQPTELTLWLAGLFALGLAVMGLMFAFVYGCERV